MTGTRAFPPALGTSMAFAIGAGELARRGARQEQSSPALTIADLAAIAADLKARLVEKDSDRWAIVSIALCSDWKTPLGRYEVALHGTDRVVFQSKSIEDAINQANAWLDHDEKAEANLAIGLAADGSFMAEAAE